MNELMEKLKKTYNELYEKFLLIENDKKNLDSQIDILKNKFDNPSTLEDNDYEMIISLLDEDDIILLNKNKRFFALIDRFPNQPQVKDAKKLLELLKNKIIGLIHEKNSELIQQYENYNKDLIYLKDVINVLLENYNDKTYISALDLYKILSFIDVDDNILDFYLEVLKNNNLLNFEEEDNSELDQELDNFIEKLKKINSSLSSKSCELDDTIRKKLSFLLNEAYYEEVDNEILDNMLSDFGEEKLKLLKFIIHLHKHAIELSDSQQDYLLELYNFYEKKINEIKNDDTEQNNYELIELLSEDYKFEDIELLKKVFSSNDIDCKTKLIVICSIIKNNSKKELKEKKQEFDSPIELFKSYGIDVTFIDSDQVSKLKRNISNVNEITNLLMKRVPDFLPTLFSDIITSDGVINILSDSSSVIINKLIKVCDEAGLDFETVIKTNPFVLLYKNKSFDNVGLYEYFIENIKFFKEKNIDLNSAFYALYEDNNLVKRRYNILTNLYNIDITGNEFLLASPTAIAIIDNFIETTRHGYNFIKSNLNILAGDYNEILLALISKPEVLVVDENGFSFDNHLMEKIKLAIKIHGGSRIDFQGSNKYWNEKYDYYEALLDKKQTKNGFWRTVISEEYDCINEEIFENYYIKQLENPKNKFKKNDYIYIINGTVISRIKFLRICTCLYNILTKREETFDVSAIKYALRMGHICLEADERNIENFLSYTQQNTPKPKTKKKKK